MTHSPGLVPSLPARAWLVLGGDALSALGSGLTLPFLVVYLSQVRGIDLGLAGLMLSTVAVAGLAGNPAGGWLVDRVGPRRAVIIGLLLAAGGCAAIAAVQHSMHGFLAAALYGLGMAVLLPAADALLAMVVDVEQRGQVFALRHATMNVGLSVGALVAAVVVAHSAASAAFVALYLADAVSFLAFAGVLAALPDVRPADGSDGIHPDGYREVVRDRVFGRLWLVVLLLVTAGYAQYHAAFPAFATTAGGLSASGLGLAFAANTVTVVVAQLPVLRLMAGHRRTRGIALSSAFVGAAWLTTLGAAAVAGTTSTPLFVAAMVLFGLGETLLSPTIPALVNDLAPQRLRGRYNGAYSMAWTVGFIAGPAVAGLALAAGHGHGLFVGFVGALGVAGVVALRLERHLPSGTNLVAAAAPGSVVGQQ
jgi:MFS family permease